MSAKGSLKRKHTAFLVIDVQERLLPVIANKEMVVANTNILIKGSEILGVPLIVTEQYPKGLGNTSKEVTLPEGKEVIEKMCFSCFLSEPVKIQLNKLKIRSVVLAGIEAHICVLKTALDLLDNGFEVHVVADAVGSRNENNHRIALKRMKQSGAFIVSTEMVLFQLIDVAGTDEFKQISKLIK
jgi:nicotinamidase-related amidase